MLINNIAELRLRSGHHQQNRGIFANTYDIGATNRRQPFGSCLPTPAIDRFAKLLIDLPRAR